jgi:hypothetical protein
LHTSIDKNKLVNKIDEMMLNKKAICDFEYSDPKGRKFSIYPMSAVDYKRLISRQLGNGYQLLSWPQDSVLVTDNILITYKKKETPLEFDFFKNYVEFFDYESGGLTIYNLRKTSNGFDFIQVQSLNYGYFVRDKEFNNVLQAWLPSQRPDVQQAHEAVFNSYSDKNIPNGYVKNSKMDILKTKAQKSFFYRLENTTPTDSNEFGGTGHNWAKWSTAMPKDITELTINGFSYPYANNEYSIWIREEGEHYEYCISRIMTATFFGLYLILYFTIFFSVFRHFSK